MSFINCQAKIDRRHSFNSSIFDHDSLEVHNQKAFIKLS